MADVNCIFLDACGVHGEAHMVDDYVLGWPLRGTPKQTPSGFRCTLSIPVFVSPAKLENRTLWYIKLVTGFTSSYER